MIDYDVLCSDPLSHQFTVRLTIPTPNPQGQRVSMPTWIPGSYFIRDFARHIITIKAFSGNNFTRSVSCVKQNSHAWQIEKVVGPLLLEYTVYAYDTSVRGAYLDDEQAFINPCSLLLMVDGQEEQPCKVKLSPPALETAKNWRVATTLTPLDAKPLGFGWYQAASYDELIDKPIQMGHFDLIEFSAKGIPHAVAITGSHTGDLKRLTMDLQKICEAHLSLFEAPFPFSRYLFLLNLRKDSYGGLEHRDSTALQIQRDYLPEEGEMAATPNYITLLGLFSHEYFHAWNIKRIKPQSFMPYALSDKSFTRQLWAFEGITSYFDELALVRSHVITLEQYLDLLAQTITRLLKNPGRLQQTVLDSSFDAWIKFYQPNENSINSQVSYYLKGSIIALAIDLSLRSISHTSLDKLMQMLWQDYGLKNVGVPEDAIPELIGNLGGEKLQALLQQALHTTEDIDLNPLLAHFGLTLKYRQAQGLDDLGGKREPVNPVKGATLGLSVSKTQGKIVVTQVLAGSRAAKAGITVQDEIIAIDNSKVDADSYDKILKKAKPGQQVKIHLFRQEKLKVVETTWDPLPLDTVEIVLNPTLTDAQKTLLTSWLKINIT